MATVIWSTRKVEWTLEAGREEAAAEHGVKMVLSDLEVYEGTHTFTGVVLKSKRRRRHWATRGALGVIVSVRQARLETEEMVTRYPRSETVHDAVEAFRRVEQAFGG